MSSSVILAFLGIVFGPLLAYFVAVRRLSGSIKTSEATSLWEESANLRKEYRSQIERLEARITMIEEVNSKLRVENGGLNKIVTDQKQQIENLQAAVDVLTKDNRALRLRVLELETINGNEKRN